MEDCDSASSRTTADGCRFSTCPRLVPWARFSGVEKIAGPSSELSMNYYTSVVGAHAPTPWHNLRRNARRYSMEVLNEEKNFSICQQKTYSALLEKVMTVDSNMQEVFIHFTRYTIERDKGEEKRTH